MIKLAAVLCAGLVPAALGQGVLPRLQDADGIEWKASGSLPPGAEYHLVFEDPATHAVESLVSFPSGYTLPPHFHSHDETVVVLKGKLIVGVGSETRTLGPGSYAVFPAGQSHSFKAKGWGGCRFLIVVNGPYDIKGLPALPNTDG